MPESIRTLLAETHVGRRHDLTWDEVTAWLQRSVLTEHDKERRMRAARRHDLYRGGGNEHMASLIQAVHNDPVVQKKRRDWIDIAKHTNPIRRVVNELASVYSVPARRRVAGTADNARYQLLQRRCRQDQMALRWNRWTALHGAVLVGPRTRELPTGETEPVIDLVTPDHFVPLASPVDGTMMIGVLINVEREGPRTSEVKPQWRMYTAEEQVYVDDRGRILRDTIEPNPYGRIPYILVSFEPPDGALIDEWACEDLAAAHRQIWYLHVLLAKEAKSATKVPIVTGDVTSDARQQAADTDIPIQLRESVVNVADFGMDLDIFRASARYVYESVAADHGLPPQLLHHAGVQSAEARELLRAPLKELRREQEVYYREMERQFVELQSMVIRREMPELAFSTQGWAIDFRDTTTPLDPKSALEVFEQSRRLGLTDTATEIMARDPDIQTAADAMQVLADRIAIELERNRLMRPLQQISGSMGATSPDDETPTPGDNRAQADAGPNRANEATPANGRGRQR